MSMRAQVIGRGGCLVLAAAVLCLRCSGGADPDVLRPALVGHYRLVAKSPPADARLESGELTLMSDGRSRLQCQHRDGRRSDVGGTWIVTSQPSVVVSPFKDCAGLWPSFQENTAAELLVEKSNPLVLVLDPDIVGVFYEKVP